MWFKKKTKAEKIKSRNTKKLRSQGIDVIAHLPFLDEPDFRTSDDVAKRIMVLMALFQLHLDAPVELISEWIDSNGLGDNLTEEEKQFLSSNFNELPEQDQINIYWFVEALWAFAWIGGIHNNLTYNTAVEDSLSTMLPNIQHGDTAEQFLKGFKLRDRNEIFEKLDAFYRVHWFAKDKDQTGIKSDKVNLDLIMERRKALEFVCYSEYEWDEIPMDT